LCSLNLFGQSLNETRWKTNFNNSDVIVEFTVDSLNLIIGNEQLDISTFSTNQDTLILIDHPESGCTDSIIGIYLFKIINDSMFVDLVSDNCQNRISFFDDREFSKCVLSGLDDVLIEKPSVYPNPNYSSLYFIKNENSLVYRYEVYNSVGDNIKNGKTVDAVNLDFDYSVLYLKLINGYKTYVYKLIRI